MSKIAGDGIITISFQIILWGFRILQDASGVRQDLKWILPYLLLFYRQALYLEIMKARPYAGMMLWFILICTIFLIFHHRRIDRGFSMSSAGRKESTQDSIPKPLIFPCRTSHVRMSPKKHSFSFSYLYVGVPIGWQGSSGSLLSAEGQVSAHNMKEMTNTPKTGSSWFHVEATGYLSRGDHAFGLKGKLNDYLISQVRFLDKHRP
jgi:hypothetical protein